MTTADATPAAATIAAPTPAAKAAVPAAPAAKAPEKGSQLKPSGGLKKGFLGGGSAVSRPNKVASAVSGSDGGGGGSGSGSRGGCGSASAAPMLRADPGAKAKSLQLPEVQQTLQAEQAEAAKLGGGGKSASWMTPELLQKIAAKPILRKAFTDPRCQAAMAEMQTDPQAAMRKYADVAEMREFLQAYMKLMGEHFSQLAEKQEAERAAAAPPATPEERKAQEAAQKAMADPEVRAIVQEPAVQKLLENMQRGVPFEVDKTDPALVRKLKKLSDAGLLKMEWQR